MTEDQYRDVKSALLRTVNALLVLVITASSIFLLMFLWRTARLYVFGA